MTTTAPDRDIAVVGSGSLARSICYSLAVAADPPPRTVTVLARNETAAQEIACIADARAAASSAATRFRATAVDARDRDAMAGLLRRIAPRVVVNCASVQSPWEAAHAPSGWTRLLSEAGFGLALPLHAVLAREVACAVRSAGVPAVFVNACYPDAVNPVLHAEGIPVACGVGNVATLAAALRAVLRPRAGVRLRVLAHHSHLHAPADPHHEVRAWLDDQPVQDVGRLLAAHRACGREELNAVTGHTAALFLARLAAGAETYADLPGPLGLPGGYPVRVRDRQITLDLPHGITRKEAIAWQQRMAGLDGVVVTSSGRIHLGPRAASALAGHLPGDCAGRPTDSVRELTGQLLDLRDTLRATPA
ncbi:hypothetical protein GCM10010521_42050 [Streptomyces rameus]|uniref:Uncharacterized protein n=1 Tax=Streptomyces rameus TaxID=68261 RepID=A0ABP6NLC6_9ACTN